MFPLQDTKSTGKLQFWTLIIILLNIYVFFLELTVPNPDLLINRYALIPNLVDFSKLITLWPFVTSQFLHGGFIHIISNMWFLWIFGDNVEEKFGFFFFPIFYLLAGAVGGLLQYLFLPDTAIPMLGASGAIAGVLGAYYALFPHNKVKTLVFLFPFVTVIEVSTSLMLFYWFIIQLFSGAAAITLVTSDLGGIAYFAHVGGFITGWLIGKLAHLG